MEIESLGNEKLPSVVKDPFSKNKVTKIWVQYSKGWINESWSAYGKIEFENGQTKGEQSFNGGTFDEVVVKIKACIDNL